MQTNKRTVKKKISKFKNLINLYTLFIMGVFAILFLVTIIVVFISLFSTPIKTVDKNNPEYIIEVESVEITDAQDLVNNDTIEPVTEIIDPNEQINLNLYSNEILPKVFNYNYPAYNTFNSNNPDFKTKEEKIVVIDPGHEDSTKTIDVWLSPYLNPEKSSSWVNNYLVKIGAKGASTKIPEYETTNTIAGLLKAALEVKGYTVILTKDSVSTMMGGAQRAAVANKNNADLMISLHCDAYKDSSVRGACVLVPEIWDGYPSKQLAYLSEKAANIILSEYTKATGIKNRGAFSVIETSMFSFSKTPIFLLEMGYVSNKTEDGLLNDSKFQEDIINGISNGIDKYFSLLTN